MRRTELLARAEDLRVARTPYVLATVVRAQRPTSAKPGDSALILADGTFDGFVGGTCAESTVRLQGLRLLETGASTLLRITPDPLTAGDRPAPEAEGLIVVNNPCLSGGSLEIFLEAMIPAPLLYVYGDAPVARALQRIGSAAVVDVFGTAWSYALMLARLRERTGLTVGRAWQYRRDDPGFIQELASGDHAGAKR